MEEKIILVDSRSRFFAKFLSYVILVTGFMYIFSLGVISEPDKLFSGLLITGPFTGFMVLILEQVWAGINWGLKEYNPNKQEITSLSIKTPPW